jgi:predicted amidohydrolase YtcJ
MARARRGGGAPRQRSAVPPPRRTSWKRRARGNDAAAAFRNLVAAHDLRAQSADRHRNNARAFRLATGSLAVGQPADLVVCDAPAASMAADAFAPP